MGGGSVRCGSVLKGQVRKDIRGCNYMGIYTPHKPRWDGAGYRTLKDEHQIRRGHASTSCPLGNIIEEYRKAQLWGPHQLK